FVLGGLVAILAGYLVHRWLEGQRGNRIQRLAEKIIAGGIVAGTIWLAETTVGAGTAATPILTGLCFAGAAIVALPFVRNRSALAATVLLGAFVTADLAYNNAPHESTGLPSMVYDAL